MKKCTQCEVEKSLDDFFFVKARDSHDSFCKECRRAYGKRWRQGDGLYNVYYLPEHHYVGMSNRINARLSQHRKQGRITEGYEIVYKCKTPAMALLMEAYLHTMGYEGCRY